MIQPAIATKCIAAAAIISPNAQNAPGTAGALPSASRGGAARDHGGWEPPARPPRRGDFLGEPVAEVGLLGELDPDGLDRDQAPCGRPGQIDLPHSARAEPADERIATDLLRIPSAQWFR